MVVMTARIEANPGARRELTQALLEWAVAARAVDDVEAYLYEDLECAHVFGFVSHWPTLEALERHVRGHQFGGLVGAVELLAAGAVVSMVPGDGRSGFREFRRRVQAGTPFERRALDS